MNKADICIVGGAGHVGLPLALAFSKASQRVLIYDINEATLNLLKEGKMPFMENGAEPLLQEALKKGLLSFSSKAEDLQGIPNIITTIGTPVDEHLNPALLVIDRCLQAILRYVSEDSLIVLRSTVYPGTTEKLHRDITASGKRVSIAFCPERIVQGLSIEELRTLPQIISGTTPEAEERSAALFELISPSVVKMKTLEAEFSKLFSNAYRYINFAVANQFYMIAARAGVDYNQILAGMKKDYPRLKDMPKPGFAAGPCLLKDTLQLAAFQNNSFPLGFAAMSVNEGLPHFVVESIKAKHEICKLKVGILGMAFKADNDDIRDSLSYKLGKILRFEGAEVYYSDEYVKDSTFISKEDLVDRASVIIVGAPHSAYRALRIPEGKEIVDLWQVVGK